MHSVEDLGLLKIDFLGLKNLTIIEDTLRLLFESTGENIKIADIPLDDVKTFELLRSANNTGVFQFESSGMRKYMKDLQPTELEDLIALVSLYRPGSMEHIPSYILRKHGKEKIAYIHPKLKPILENTYGIGVYQEQMMRIARDLGGFTLAEADTLRKAIGKKMRSLLIEQEQKLVKGMIKNGIDDKTAAAIWDLFPPFARYGFNRSHAACYALIGYQTAYLKAHYPVEFTTSLLNADSSDTDRISFLVSEAKKNNIEVLPPDINRSSAHFQPDNGNIRFGLLAVKNVGANVVDAIVEERARSGDFLNLSDFITRVDHKDVNKKSLESLIKCGAFDSIGVERKQAVNSMDDILLFSRKVKLDRNSSQNNLFDLSGRPVELVLKPHESATKKEMLLWEKELLGLYISDHPLNHIKDRIKNIKASTIGDLLKEKGNEKKAKAYGIISEIKKTMTKLGQPMLFAKIEDFSETIEVIVFSDTIQKNSSVWQENNAVLVSGRMSWRRDDPKFICDSAQLL